MTWAAGNTIIVEHTHNGHYFISSIINSSSRLATSLNKELGLVKTSIHSLSSLPISHS